MTGVCAVCNAESETRTCLGCFSRLRGLLAALPDEFAVLLDSRIRAQGGGSGRSATRIHAPVPGNEEVLNLLGPASRHAVADGEDQVGSTPILEVLGSWCEALADERHLTPVRRTVTSMTDRLLKHLGWICEQVWVVDFDAELTDLLRAVRRVTLTQPRRVPWSGVRCPSCDSLTLYRAYPGDWVAECVICPAVRLGQEDFEGLVKIQAADAQATVNS